MARTVLILAGCFEVAGAVAPRCSRGFTRLCPSVVFSIMAWLTCALLSQALKSTSIDTAFTAWTGVHAVGVAIFGIVGCSESTSLARVLFSIPIVAGIPGPRRTESGGGP